MIGTVWRLKPDQLRAIEWASDFFGPDVYRYFCGPIKVTRVSEEFLFFMDPTGVCEFPFRLAEFDCQCTVRDLWTFGHVCGRQAPIDRDIRVSRQPVDPTQV